MGFLRMLASFIAEIFFDHKDEYTFSSAKFNMKKVMTLVFLVLSLLMNAFLIKSYFDLAERYFTVKGELIALQDPKNPQLKK